MPKTYSRGLEPSGFTIRTIRFFHLCPMVTSFWRPRDFRIFTKNDHFLRHFFIFMHRNFIFRFFGVFGLRGRSSYNTANNTGKNDRKTRASLGILSQGMHCASHTPRRNVFSGANAYSRSLPMIIQCQVRFSHRSTDPFPRPLQILAPVGPEIVPSLAKKSVRVEQ